MDQTVGSLFNLIPDQKESIMFGIFSVSLVLSLFSYFVRKSLIDQEEIKNIKKRISDLNKKLKGYNKKKKDTSRIQEELTKLNSDYMIKSFKPTLITMVPYMLLLSWLRQFGYIKGYIASTGYLLALPMSLPLVGSKLGWLGFYIFCSFCINNMINRLLNYSHA